MRTSVSRKGQTIALAQFVTRRKSVCGVAKAAKTRAKNKRANTPKASGTAARRALALEPADIHVYTFGMGATAKVFKSGNSQAVRLPRQFRFAAGVDELSVEKDGERLVLSPVRTAAFSREFWRALGAWPSFERPAQVRQRRRRIFP